MEFKSVHPSLIFHLTLSGNEVTTNEKITFGWSSVLWDQIDDDSSISPSRKIVPLSGGQKVFEDSLVICPNPDIATKILSH
ncbi:hypothetical protein ACPV3S_15780 [Photobacterium damselae]|uniref:hypothetical protein n=1 Tax=Photobacterium damselae TaxID=38293 RepID=UPI0040682C62